MCFCQKKSEIRLWEFKRLTQVHTTTSDEMGTWTQLLHISSSHHVMFPMHSSDLLNDTVRSYRTETMTDLTQEIRNIILAKWLFWLPWYRFLETSLYIILFTPPCPFPLGWAWKCVCTHMWVCACVCFNLYEKQNQADMGGGEEKNRKVSTNTCSRYKPRATNYWMS